MAVEMLLSLNWLRSENQLIYLVYHLWSNGLLMINTWRVNVYTICVSSLTQIEASPMGHKERLEYIHDIGTNA